MSENNEILKSSDKNEKSTPYPWVTGRHCYFKNIYNIVLMTRHRGAVLNKEMIEKLEECIEKRAKQMDGDLIELCGEEDHIHLIIEIPPKTAVATFIGRLKAYSSSFLIKNFKAELKGKLWGKLFWAQCYLSTTYATSDDYAIGEYIDKQREPASEASIKQSLQEKKVEVD